MPVENPGQSSAQASQMPAQPKPPPSQPKKEEVNKDAENRRKVEITVNGKTAAKLALPEGVDPRKLWPEFQKEHSHVSDKKGAFPSMFIGDLVNKHGCEQLHADANTGEKIELRH